VKRLVLELKLFRGAGFELASSCFPKS